MSLGMQSGIVREFVLKTRFYDRRFICGRTIVPPLSILYGGEWKLQVRKDIQMQEIFRL